MRNSSERRQPVSGGQRDFDFEAKKENVDNNIPPRAMFYGEIGEKDRPRDTSEYTDNALQETGKDVPANYMTDNNGEEEI